MSGGILSRKVKVSNTEANPLFVEVVNGDDDNIESDFADGNISAVKAVYTTLSGVALANNNIDFQQASVIGLTRTSAISGNKITYQIIGKFQDSSLVFTLGSQIYLDVNGNLTDIAPASGFRTVVGTAGQTGTININIQEPIIL
tara:strand:- start:1242 stop:1673 length:432 start_codon:yes stop_codon:yes gene_type:complete